MTTTAEAAPGAVPPPLEDPTDLRRQDLKLALRRSVSSFSLDDVPNLAAGVAFKIFLALFPSLLAGIAIFSIVVDRAELVELIDRLTDNLPQAASEIVDTTLREIAATPDRAAGALAIFGILAGIFSATGAAASLVKALNRAYGIPEQRKFVAVRLIGLILAVALTVALVALVLLIIAGGGVQAFLLPDSLEVPVVTVPLTIARYLLALGVLVVLLAFVYWIGPNRERPTWSWLSPGAVLGLVLVVLATVGFRLYTQVAGNYEASYGALAGVIVLLLWLQLAMLGVLVGAEVNAELERIRADRAAERMRALGPEGVSESELPEDARDRAKVHRAARRGGGPTRSGGGHERSGSGQERSGDEKAAGQRRSPLLVAMVLLAVLAALRRALVGGD